MSPSLTGAEGGYEPKLDRSLSWNMSLRSQFRFPNTLAEKSKRTSSSIPNQSKRLDPTTKHYIKQTKPGVGSTLAPKGPGSKEWSQYSRVRTHFLVYGDCIKASQGRLPDSSETTNLPQVVVPGKADRIEET